MSKDWIRKTKNELYKFHKLSAEASRCTSKAIQTIEAVHAANEIRIIFTYGDGKVMLHHATPYHGTVSQPMRLVAPILLRPDPLALPADQSSRRHFPRTPQDTAWNITKATMHTSCSAKIGRWEWLAVAKPLVAMTVTVGRLGIRGECCRLSIVWRG